MIEVQNATIIAGEFCLRGVNLAIPNGGYGLLMGPSGVGKTTLLEAIGGLHRVTAGRVLIDGRDVTALTPQSRSVGYVPQDNALFTAMSVRENLGFALAARGESTTLIRDRVEEIAKLLRLTLLVERRVTNLSGGEAKRVALGRAIAARPAVLLLDEPLTGLDESLKEEVQQAITATLREQPTTVLHVSHQSIDAQPLANCQFELQPGGAIVSCR